MKKIFRLGTRGSPLALIQAEYVRTLLLNLPNNIAGSFEIELVPIRTTGDWNPEMAERSLADLGINKGLFTKEIDEALFSGVVDAAVHSMKDMATILPETQELSAILERADPRDAFLSHGGINLMELPAGSKVGTSSLRRRSQVLAARPDLQVVPLRGNVETRLQKLADGMADATILAVAGLQRLGLMQRISEIMDPDLLLPAVAQGAIGIVTKRGNIEAHQLIAALNHAPTSCCITAERAYLRVLDGSCRTPIAGLARLASDKIIVLEGVVAAPDGTNLIRLQESGYVEDAVQIGEKLAEKIKSKLPADFFKNAACS